MVKINKIYTRTGDDGTSGLVDGSRISKSALRMHAIGEVDEANSAVGLAIAGLEDLALIQSLRRIQNDLFDLGADIATPANEDADFVPGEMTLRIVPQQVDWLEAEIDAANAKLEPLTSFILPGGSMAAAQMHLARTTTRRAERALVAASHDVLINPAALQYLNRLSDFLFVLCRLVAQQTGGEVKWVPGQSR